ncbi:MAG: (2Fe-2S) ferredoxin domain-containing protein [Clostridiales bacterium]|nr:(2Fe-2S) ferredoxin domain-containing protein [Clostridiales bacterium]
MNITVCIGSSCHLKGSRVVVGRLERLILENGLKDQIDLCGTFCLGCCQSGVSVQFDGAYYSLSPENTERFFIETVLPLLRDERVAGMRRSD